METFLGIGFVFLCLSVLVGIAGIVRYHLYIDKEKVDISPAADTNQSKNSTNE